MITQSTTLDIFCNLNNVYPDIIKVDIEGSEIEMLKGATKILKKYKPLIFLSYHPYHIKKLGYQNSLIFDILTMLNYKIYDLEGNQPLKLKNSEYLLIHKKRNVDDIFKEKIKLIVFFDILINRGLATLISSIINLLHLNLLKKVFNKKLIIKKVNEYKMYLLTNDNGISRSLILFGKREEDKIFILNKIFKKDMNIFDIGANIGYYTIFFLIKIKQGKNIGN